MIRIIRFMAFFLTLTVPSAYVSLVTFHQETIPTPLLISIAAQREGVPFPALLEAFLMEIIFEILWEAGIRMPRAIGPAISIVGALVIGQAAVEAGIISAVMVIVVSLTAISSFAISNYAMANTVRLIRFALMVMAGLLGLYGVFIGLLLMYLHLCKLKSIGIPYLTPLAPKIKDGNKDIFFRYPLWKMNLRPSYISSSKEPRARGEKIVTKNEKGKDIFSTLRKITTAHKILHVITPFQTVPGIGMYNSLKTSEKVWAPTKSVKIVELVNSLTSEGKSLVLTGVETLTDDPDIDSIDNLKKSDPSGKLSIKGLGAFKNDKLVGWLNEDESKGYNYITDNVKNTVRHME